MKITPFNCSASLVVLREIKPSLACAKMRMESVTHFVQSKPRFCGGAFTQRNLVGLWTLATLTLHVRAEFALELALPDMIKESDWAALRSMLRSALIEVTRIGLCFSEQVICALI